MNAMLRVDIQSSPPAVTLVCCGRIVLGVEAETLRCMAMSRAERLVLVEMSRVYAIDAAGLGLLVELHQWAQKRGASLVVANPSLRPRQLMRLTNLDQVLHLAGADGGVAGRDAKEWRFMTA